LDPDHTLNSGSVLTYKSKGEIRNTRWSDAKPDFATYCSSPSHKLHIFNLLFFGAAAGYIDQASYTLYINFTTA
jgi:hypothetical protein